MTTQALSGTRPDEHALTEQQVAMLDFIAAPQDTYYLVTELFRLEGELDVSVLRSAVRLLVERHGMARARFDHRSPVYRIKEFDSESADAMLHDGGETAGVDEAVAAASAWLRAPLRLAEEPPLRFFVTRCGEKEWVFGAAGHHLVFDGWSFKIVWEELSTSYRAMRAGQAPPLKPAPQYGQAASARRADRPVADRSAEFGRPYSAIRALQERAASPLGPARREYATVAQGLDELVVAQARARDTTPYALGCAAMLRALAEVLGDDQGIFGTAFAGRLNGAAVRTVGYFSTSIFVAADLAFHTTDEALLDHVKRTVAQWQAGDRLQWERVLDAYGARDLYPVKFSFQPAAMVQPEPALEGLVVHRIVSPPGSTGRRPLDLAVRYGGGAIDVDAAYREDAIDLADVRRLVDGFAQQLRKLCGQ
jgi:mycobactin peptide synthetase MbtE